MKRTIVYILAGFIFCISGVIIVFISLQDIAAGNNLWILVISVILVVLGVFFFIRAGKAADSTIVEKPVTTEPNTNQPQEKKGFETLLERNNNLMQQWRKIDETKNKLKVLQASGEGQ